jgi:uncharacterized Zn finger protein
MVTSQSPFANVLHVETIARLARASAMERGRAYVDRVLDLQRRDARLLASVRGSRSRPYAISIWVKGDGLGYVCSCAAGADGEFCKHLVAVALVWVERSRQSSKQ